MDESVILFEEKRYGYFWWIVRWEEDGSTHESLFLQGLESPFDHYDEALEQAFAFYEERRNRTCQ